MHGNINLDFHTTEYIITTYSSFQESMGNTALKLEYPQTESYVGVYGEISPDIDTLIHELSERSVISITSLGKIAQIGTGPVIIGSVDLNNWEFALGVQALMQETNKRGIAVLQTSTPVYLRGYVDSNHLHIGGENTLTGNEAAIVLPKFFRLANMGITGKFSIQQILEANIF